MAGMVDKIIDLLPVYLAISQEREGSRRLLVMVCRLLYRVIDTLTDMLSSALHVQRAINDAR